MFISANDLPRIIGALRWLSNRMGEDGAKSLLKSIYEAPDEDRFGNKWIGLTDQESRMIVSHWVSLVTGNLRLPYDLPGESPLQFEQEIFAKIIKEEVKP